MAVDAQPILLIVNGLPATGKTTLAQNLSAQLRWPVFHKDDFKEALFDTLGWHTRVESSRLGIATIRLLYLVVEAQLAAGTNLILENNFKPDTAAAAINAALEKHNAKALQILCECDPAVRVQRFMSRRRHPGHADNEITPEIAADMQRETLAPVMLDAPLLRVETTHPDKDQLAGVLSWVRHHIQR